MREDLVLKLQEIIEHATSGIKYEITNRRLRDEEPMINIIVSLLNYNIEELKEILEGEE